MSNPPANGNLSTYTSDGTFKVSLITGSPSRAYASLATISALGASSVADGEVFLDQSAGRLWRYAAASTLTADGGFLVAAATGAGVGAFIAMDRTIDIQAAVSSATTDATVLYTVPAGFRLRLTVPFWSVSVTFTTSSAGAAGLKSSNAGLNTAGDILGGASGDLVATLVSTGAYAKGTVGAKIGKPPAVLSGGDTVIYNLIAGTYTAGTGIAHIAVEVLLAPAA